MSNQIQTLESMNLKQSQTTTHDKDSYLNHKTIEYLHNNKTYYPNYNHQGSLISLIDINGNIVKEITYNPYGKILKDTNPSLIWDLYE